MKKADAEIATMSVNVTIKFRFVFDDFSRVLLVKQAV